MRWLIPMVVVACGARVDPPVPRARVAAPLGPSCGGARLLPTPADPSQRGPWLVGARTIQVEELTVEVWYPARRPTVVPPPVRYDLRTAMPKTEAAKIPDAANAWLACDCFRDLEVDDRHGPYPVVMFLHGAASFRAQSAFLATHWASRGFVVVAPDLPGVGLRAMLGESEDGSALGTPQRVLDLVARRPDGADPLAFVREHLAHRSAIVGHSLGSMLAGTIAERADVEVRIAMAGTAVSGGSSTTLLLAGDRDGIARPEGFRTAITAAKPPVRLVMLRGAGHLAFTDLCPLGAERGGALAIARAHGVAIPELLATLATDGCRSTDKPFATTAPAIAAATAAALEERLRCDPRATSAFTSFASRFDAEVVERLA